MAVMAKSMSTRLVMPYAPTAKSPPYLINERLMMMTTKQLQAFIKKGDRPIEKMRPTIEALSLLWLLSKCTKLCVL